MKCQPAILLVRLISCAEEAIVAVQGCIHSAERGAGTAVRDEGGCAKRQQVTVFVWWRRSPHPALILQPPEAPSCTGPPLTLYTDACLSWFHFAHGTFMDNHWFAEFMQKRDFSIIFRTFGADIMEVVDEMNMFATGQHPCYPEVAPFWYLLSSAHQSRRSSQAHKDSNQCIA